MKLREDLEDLKTRFKEASLHMIIYILIWALLLYALLSFLQNNIIYISLGVLSVIIFIFMITRNLKDEQLVVYSWICLICIMLFGSAVGKFVNIEILLPAIIGVSVFDVFSFTKLGKKTANAKLMSSKKWLSRLIVYGKSFKDGKPVGTKGFGDYMWYSIAFSTIYTTLGKIAGLYSLIAIIIGTIVNLIVINQIYKYKWYKGFPATIIPLGFCVILVIIFTM